MKKAKNELLLFLAGLAMLVVGLFIFSQKVMVYSGFFGGWMMFGGFHLNNGLIMVPLIIGIVWMFASGGSFPSKIMTGLGGLIIVAAIILSTNISLTRVTLYEWILILVLIFGGAGILVRILLADRRENSVPRGEEKCPQIRETEQKIQAIESEIEKIKKEL